MISLSLSLYFSSLRKRTYESESTTATTCIVGIVVLIPSVSLCINRVNCRVEDHIVQRSFRVQARGRPAIRPLGFNLKASERARRLIWFNPAVD
jgi:hypothetical protein